MKAFSRLPYSWATPERRMVRDPATEWLKADAASREFVKADCEHDPTCGSGLAHYEREFGIMLPGGPAENRAKYHETSVDFQEPDDLARAEARERHYTPERNRKRRRGYTPNGAGMTGGDCSD